MLLALVACAGCGGYNYGPTGRITGRLTMDGKPLPQGTSVSFMQMEKGYLALGLTDADGKFEVGNAPGTFNQGDMPVGTYKVMISLPSAEAQRKEMTPEEAFDNPDITGEAVKAEFPAKYRDVATSGLEFEIQPGKTNNFEIDLKSQ
jgi:hypothetical protein